MRTFAAFIPSQTAVTSFTSAPIPVGDLGNITVAATLTGVDVAGSLLVQGAMTEDFARPYPLATATAVTASSDPFLTFPYIGVPWVRIVWTYTSGTGTIAVDISMLEPILKRGG